jgi:hypothetical protein
VHPEQKAVSAITQYSRRIMGLAVGTAKPDLRTSKRRSRPTALDDLVQLPEQRGGFFLGQVQRHPGEMGRAVGSGLTWCRQAFAPVGQPDAGAGSVAERHRRADQDFIRFAREEAACQAELSSVAFGVARYTMLAIAGLIKRHRPVPQRSKHNRRQRFGKGGAGANEILALFYFMT